LAGVSSSNRLTAIIEATLAVFAWGITFVATKIALRYIQPVAVVWLRFAIGVLILGIVVLLRRQFQLPKSRDYLYFALTGIIGITFHQWLQSTGMVTSQATTSAWIVATTPIFMALLGSLFLKEYLSNIQKIGIFLAAAGVLLVVSRGDFSQLFTGKFGAPGDFKLGCFFHPFASGAAAVSCNPDDILCDAFWLDFFNPLVFFWSGFLPNPKFKIRWLVSCCLPWNLWLWSGLCFLV